MENLLVTRSDYGNIEYVDNEINAIDNILSKRKFLKKGFTTTIFDSKNISEYANKLIDNIVLAESISGQVDVTFGIDGDILDIYMGGWYVTSVNMGGLSAEARYEIGIDLNYDDSNNKGGKDGRPDRELY